MRGDLDPQCVPVAERECSPPRAGAPDAAGAGRVAAAGADEDVPLIGEIRTRASVIAREEVARTLRRLSADPELAARLDAMAGSIVSTLLREPSVRLRRAASEGDAGEAILAAAKEMFLAGSDPAAPRRNLP